MNIYYKVLLKDFYDQFEGLGDTVGKIYPTYVGRQARIKIRSVADGAASSR